MSVHSTDPGILSHWQTAEMPPLDLSPCLEWRPGEWLGTCLCTGLKDPLGDSPQIAVPSQW